MWTIKETSKIAEEVLGNLDEQGYLTIEPMLISDRLRVDEQDSFGCNAS